MAQGKIVSASVYGPEPLRTDEKAPCAASPPKPVNVRNTSAGVLKRRLEKQQAKAEAKALKLAQKIAEGTKTKGWKKRLAAERWRNALPTTTEA